MKHLLIILFFSLALSACGNSSGGNDATINASLDLPAHPDSEVVINDDDGRDSETHLETETSLEELYAYYHDFLTQKGWQREDLETEDDKIEADYRKDNVKLELEIEREGTGVYKVELDFDDNPNRPSPPAGTTLLNGRLGLPAYPGSSIVSLDDDDDETEARFESTASLEEIYVFFHDFLTQEGWERDDHETEGNEIEAEYERDDEEFEFELEREGTNRYKLEIEFDD